ncbi:YhgE/Pip domain-containing protein [Cellulomonas wangsupingiae]|uniref:YhgE/Pip domain-containing protein n=1 Tax=Cellulomonas wangsupingiae TaxID=2968085 RepID=A0ABY5K5B3_9CELL|nr:YhgE/Pip domain-containing protein [Cellulomonas wangsupingiae]MCC2336154.1 YhgE/Pip domain-containing protein [Cellulomonas wangsupingiae]UUI64601.1 YhgE/Pip domain-containing protein [Cellulomonas wangsupingiae]
MSRTPVTRPSARRWPAVVVALAAPIALVVVLLAASWAPADGLARVQAAVVNEDEPVTLEGQYTPLGRQLAGALVEGSEVAANYEWVVTDEADATAGLQDGTYAAVVTIPENFSAAATSFASGEGTAEQATVEITSPPGATTVDQAVASTVTTAATRVLGEQLTTTYIENVLVGFTTLSEQLGEAADGATALADGVGQLADGTGQLATGADGLATGAATLADGTTQLQDGSYELATGTSQLATGARGLADGAQQLADGAGASATGARELANGATGLTTGTSQLAGGLGQTAAQIADPTTGLPALDAGATGLATGTRQLVTEMLSTAQLLATVNGCTAPTDSPTCGIALGQVAALQEQLDPASAESLVNGADRLAGGIGVAVNGDGTVENPGLVVGLQQLAGGAAALDTGARTLAGGAGQLADGIDQLAAGTSGLADGASTLADGASQLAGGSSQLAAGVAQLGGGASQLADGSAQLADGVRQTNEGAGQLAQGTAELGTGLGQAVDQLPTTPEDERANLAQVVTAPVAAPSSAVSAPLGLVSTLVAVALWIGALVLFLVFRPLPARVAGSTRSALGLVAGALALPAAVSAVAGAAVGAVAGGITDQGLGRTLGLVAVGALAAVALAAFHQAVAAWFGTAGRVVAVVAGFAFLVAGLAVTVPAWVGSSVGWLPLGPVADGLGAVVGESPASLLGAVVALLLWGVASVLASAGAATRARQAVGARTVAAYA